MIIITVIRQSELKFIAVWIGGDVITYWSKVTGFDSRFSRGIFYSGESSYGIYRLFVSLFQYPLSLFSSLLYSKEALHSVFNKIGEVLQLCLWYYLWFIRDKLSKGKLKNKKK